MAKEQTQPTGKPTSKPNKFTVSVKEYSKEMPAVTTEGTVEEAIKAFQLKHGVDGLNLKWEIVEEGSGASVSAPVPPPPPPPPVVPIPPVVPAAPTPASAPADPATKQ